MHQVICLDSPFFLYQFLSYTHTYFFILLGGVHTILYTCMCLIVHAWMCPKWLNRILLSLKMCEYATKPNDCMTWSAKEVLTSWYVLKCYRQFLLKMVVLTNIFLKFNNTNFSTQYILERIFLMFHVLRRGIEIYW